MIEKALAGKGLLYGLGLGVAFTVVHEVLQASKPLFRKGQEIAVVNYEAARVGKQPIVEKAKDLVHHIKGAPDRWDGEITPPRTTKALTNKAPAKPRVRKHIQVSSKAT